MVDRGTKRKCSSCGISYYDLNRTPIECPKCGARYEASAPGRVPRGRLPVAPPPPRALELEETVEESEEEETAESDVEETEDLPSDEEAFVPPENEDERD